MYTIRVYYRSLITDNARVHDFLSKGPALTYRRTRAALTLTHARTHAHTYAHSKAGIKLDRI